MQDIHTPVYVIPILIEQPTWGGQYIKEFKRISALDAAMKIGQSYELAAESLVYQGYFQECFQLARGGKIDSLENHSIPSNAQPLSTYAEKEAFPLIKFTQAQENSYQLHVKQPTPSKTGEWQPKPESWYFFEEGYATLGVTQETAQDPAAYRARCEAINEYAGELSQQVTSNEISLEEARTQLAAFIETDHPRNYVNSVRVPKNSVVDLSEGAVHHSWEAHPDLPLGNIVYEVQNDVKDDVSTLRSFDQGKIKEDGSIRELTIPEYFAALERDLKKNNPETLVQSVPTDSTPAADFVTLFDSPHYKLIQASWKSSVLELPVSEKYQHIFVKEGSIRVEGGNESWVLPQGWSMLIPPKSPFSLKNSETATQKQITVLLTT